MDEKRQKEDVIKKTSHFCSNCNQITRDSQIEYLWPFPLVQCNTNSKLELKPAGEMGLGIFTNVDIVKGEYLCCYFGKITHITEEYSDYNFGINLPNNAYAMTIDSKNYGNISRFFNHSYEPNCTTTTEYHYNDWQKETEEPYITSHYWQYIESKTDKNRYFYYRDNHESVWDKPEADLVRWPIFNKEEPHITFRAVHDIKKDEQLFINYGKDYWEGRNKTPL